MVLQSYNMDNKTELENKSSKEDNTWGYVVCFGTIITIVASIGHVNSFGVIYHEFIIETGSTAKSLTTAHGVFGIMLAVGGLILNLLSKRHTLRYGGYIGAIILSVGSFSTIIITNMNQLSFTFGILQGIGFGIMVPVCYSTINQYFAQRRTVIMSICKATQGIIFMWYPQFIKRILTSYGFRGTLLILTALSLHVFPGMATMKARDVRSRKRKEIIRNGIEENIILLEVVSHSTDTKEAEIPKTNARKIWLNVMSFLNIKVWKDPIYCNICLGLSFTNFSDLTFFILHPLLLFQYGYEVSDVTMCISIGAGADVAGRFALAIFSYLLHFNTRVLFYGATLFTFFFRIVLLQVRQFMWVALVTGILGLLRASLHVTSPLVIANHIPHEEFPGAYATFMLATGIVQLLCAPLIGLIKDMCEDYIPAFYVLAISCLPCIVFWPIEYIIWNK